MYYLLPFALRCRQISGNTTTLTLAAGASRVVSNCNTTSHRYLTTAEQDLACHCGDGRSFAEMLNCHEGSDLGKLGKEGSPQCTAAL